MIKYMTFCKITLFQPVDTQFLKLLWPEVNIHSYCVQPLCIYMCVCVCVCVHVYEYTHSSQEYKD